MCMYIVYMLDHCELLQHTLVHVHAHGRDCTWKSIGVHGQPALLLCHLHSRTECLPLPQCSYCLIIQLLN